MTKRIFRAVLTASVIAMALCLLTVTCVLYEYFFNIQKSRLRSDLYLAAEGVNRAGEEYLSSVQADGYRLTWISPDGTVLYDTDADSTEMGNHSDREEVKQALESGFGESERYSSTLTAKTLYCALKLENGSVLRMSIQDATVFSLVIGMVQPMLVIFLLVLLFSALLAGGMAKRIVGPLNKLNIDNPLVNPPYEELTPFLRRISQLRGQVAAQMREQKKKRDEFEQITGSMKEGLVLFDEDGAIISFNNAAADIFGAETHDGVKTLILDTETASAVTDTLSERHCEVHTEKNGREYQLDISVIESEGKSVGAVLLAFDVTDKVFAERNRREFTANVSHELKTPLQSITGSAELIENGLVKPEDMPRFVGHIRRESERLVALIGDIIRLSQLDEGVAMAEEDTELLSLTEGIAGELGYSAEKKNVAINVTGNPVTVRASKKLVRDIVFNLCDNAVRYNKEGGKVDVDIKEQDVFAVITVSDTGIGIPPEHQKRVFERFYRVDPSHSLKSGGTGLGLSIVKHAVRYLGGSIKLTSEPGNGTTFTVTLPKTQTITNADAPSPRA